MFPVKSVTYVPGLYLDGANNRVQTRTRSLLSGTNGPIAWLSDAGRDASPPKLAVDSTGTAVVVWSASDIGHGARVQARTRSSSGVLGPVEHLSAAGQDGSEPQVAIDANDNAVFVWTRFDGTKLRVQTRSRSAAGPLSAVQDLSYVHDASEPQVAVDPSGNAIFVWKRFDGTNDRIQARTRSMTGVLSPVETLSAAGQDAFAPRVVVDSNSGTAIVVYETAAGQILGHTGP
jgi:hypothetical protein